MISYAFPFWSDRVVVLKWKLMENKITQDCRLGTEMHCSQSWYLWQIEVVSHFWNTARAGLVDSFAFLFWIFCFLELLPVSCFVGLQRYLWPMHMFFFFGLALIYRMTGRKQTTGSRGPDVLCVCSNIFHYYSCRFIFSQISLQILWCNIVSFFTLVLK